MKLRNVCVQRTRCWSRCQHILRSSIYCTEMCPTHTLRFFLTFGIKYTQIVDASGGRREFKLHWHSWHSLSTDLHTSLACLHMALSIKTHTHTPKPIRSAQMHFDLNDISLRSSISLYFISKHTHMYHLGHMLTAGMLMCGKVKTGSGKASQNDLSISHLRDRRKREQERQEGVCVCIRLVFYLQWRQWERTFLADEGIFHGSWSSLELSEG